MDYRESTGVGSGKMRRRTTGAGVQTGAETTDQEQTTVTIDTEQIINQFVIAAIGGVASTVATRLIFGGKDG